MPLLELLLVAQANEFDNVLGREPVRTEEESDFFRMPVDLGAFWDCGSLDSRRKRPFTL